MTAVDVIIFKMGNKCKDLVCGYINFRKVSVNLIGKLLVKKKVHVFLHVCLDLTSLEAELVSSWIRTIWKLVES